MGYAVYHGSKGKGSGGGIGNHIDRVEGKEHTYKHADPTRNSLNRVFPVSQDRHKRPLSQAIADRIKEGYKSTRKIRNDSVKFLSHVLTGSPDEMKKIFADPKKAEAWIDANKNFLEKEFGKENLVRFVLHLDEKTPHLHAITTPLTSDGRLSAKEVMGNKKDLQARQDRYAELMKPFDLERGIRGTGIKHENANDYYKRVEEARNNASKVIPEPVKGFFGVDKSKTIEKLENSLKSSYLALEEEKNKLQKMELRAKGAEPKMLQAEALAESRGRKGMIANAEKKKLEQILKSPREIQKYREENGLDKDQNKDRGVSR